eukprot:735847-Amphidinium_carterae.1
MVEASEFLALSSLCRMSKDSNASAEHWQRPRSAKDTGIVHLQSGVAGERGLFVARYTHVAKSSKL